MRCGRWWVGPHLVCMMRGLQHSAHSSHLGGLAIPVRQQTCSMPGTTALVNHNRRTGWVGIHCIVVSPAQ
jgi:hypothetical protein